MTERLPLPWGSRLDRARKIRFEFDGRPLEGFAGDCIASAMAGTGRGSCRAHSNTTVRAEF
ncbi:hypothetical protein AJ88_48640 [Mesorhizobium amorphae CCBAU 01583]|nr:hypothetical protein AJ88_48640 [Mesorhizobium amorphae CCBAU 01583]